MKLSDAVERFSQYLLAEKGLSPQTVQDYLEDLKKAEVKAAAKAPKTAKSPAASADASTKTATASAKSKSRTRSRVREE